MYNYGNQEKERETVSAVSGVCIWENFTSTCVSFLHIFNCQLHAVRRQMDKRTKMCTVSIDDTVSSKVSYVRSI